MAGAAACPAAMFAWFAGPGLWGGFMPDDLMNLHLAARTPAWELARGVLAPWQGQWRPFGFLLFKGMWAAFGFHPLPYHALALALLAVNAALTAALAWRLTRSGAAAAFTGLLVCHHGYFSDLYLNSGTMFDVLAGMMCLGLLLAYAGEPRPGAARLAGRAFVYLLALQTKEIALFLPAAAWAYEWLIRRDRTALRTAWQAWAYTALAVLFCAGLLLNRSGALANPDYQPDWHPATLLRHWAHYLTFMFYQPWTDRPGFPAAVLGAAAGVAWLARDAAARWAWLAAMLAPLPLLAVTPRSFYAFYVPYLFWALLAGIALGKLAGRRAAAGIVLYAALAGLLAERHAWIRPHAEKWHVDAEAFLAPALTLLPPEAAKWPRGASILFLEDPYPEDDYTLLFVSTLAGGDLSLMVHRVKAGANLEDAGAWRYRMTREALTRVE